VADVDALLYLPGHSPEQLERYGFLHLARVGRVRSRQCSNRT
jgi:hypothetical protein